jgi:hypothetical protein
VVILSLSILPIVLLVLKAIFMFVFFKGFVIVRTQFPENVKETLSGMIAEIFIQHLEHQILKHTLEDQAITYYTRYVDDIFVIHNQDKITPAQILEHFNKQHGALHIYSRLS